MIGAGAVTDAYYQHVGCNLLHRKLITKVQIFLLYGVGSRGGLASAGRIGMMRSYTDV